MFGRANESLTHRLRLQSFNAMLRQEMGWFDMEDNAVSVLMATCVGGRLVASRVCFIKSVRV